MKRNNYIQQILNLAESEGVFTTAQAKRLGITRDALHDAEKAKRLIRIIHGAYRLMGSGSTYLDQLTAIWKLTNPGKFSHERFQATNWDGVVIGGTTAASMHNIGDFELFPYRIYSPKRINSRKTEVSFCKRSISFSDTTILNSLPVTRLERTIVDLVLDSQEPSLITGAIKDAVNIDAQFSFSFVKECIYNEYAKKKADFICASLHLL